MTRIGIAQRRHWASGPDQMLADMRFVGLYCDLDVPDASALSTALATITAAGPQTRLALTPATGKRIWRSGSQRMHPYSKEFVDSAHLFDRGVESLHAVRVLAVGAQCAQSIIGHGWVGRAASRSA